MDLAIFKIEDSDSDLIKELVISMDCRRVSKNIIKDLNNLFYSSSNEDKVSLVRCVSSVIGFYEPCDLKKKQPSRLYYNELGILFTNLSYFKYLEHMLNTGKFYTKAHCTAVHQGLSAWLSVILDNFDKELYDIF